MNIKRTTKLIFITYFISIFLPIYSNNNIGNYIKIVGNLNIIHLLLMISLCLTFYSMGLRFNKVDLFVLLYIIIAFVMYLIGVIKKYPNTLIELTWYVIPALFYYIMKYWTLHGLTIYTFMDITYYAMFGNCLINLLMFFTRSWSFWGVSTYLGTKLGGNYYTLICITFTYGIYILFNGSKRIKSHIIIISSFLDLWCLISAQSRTILLMSIFPLIGIFIFGLRDKANHRNKNNRILLLLGILTILLFSIWVFLQGNSEIMQRLRIMSFTSEDDTFSIRLNTLIHNFTYIFIPQLFGRGFGYPLHFYNSNGYPTTEVFYLDNTYMTEAIRGGIVFVGLFIYMVILPFKMLKKKYNKTKDGCYIIILLCYISYLVSATIMSGQTIHGFAVSIFLWSFISVCFYDNKSSVL